MKLRTILMIGGVAALTWVMLGVAVLWLTPLALAQDPIFDGSPGSNRMASSPMMQQMSRQVSQQLPLDGSGYGPVNSRANVNQSVALGPMAGRGGPLGLGGPANSLVAVVAEQLGMTQTDLIAELQAGKTMAEVITDRGGDIEAIIDAFVASRQERLETMVENGQITREQADALLAMMRANATERLNSPWSPRGRGNGQGFVDEDGDGVCDYAGQGRGQGAGQGFGRGGGRPGRGMMGRWANTY